VRKKLAQLSTTISLSTQLKFAFNLHENFIEINSAPTSYNLGTNEQRLNFSKIPSLDGLADDMPPDTLK
jgi:hypothetical protein